MGLTMTFSYIYALMLFYLSSPPISSFTSPLPFLDYFLTTKQSPLLFLCYMYSITVFPPLLTFFKIFFSSLVFPFLFLWHINTYISTHRNYIIKFGEKACHICISDWLVLLNVVITGSVHCPSSILIFL